MTVYKMTVDKKVLEEMPWYHFIAFTEESLINILQARAWLNGIKRFTSVIYFPCIVYLSPESL